MQVKLIDEAEDVYVMIPDQVEFPRVVVWGKQAYLYDDHGAYRAVYTYIATLDPDVQLRPRSVNGLA
jgi:hypothetical protein